MFILLAQTYQYTYSHPHHRGCQLHGGDPKFHLRLGQLLGQIPFFAAVYYPLARLLPDD